MRLGEKAQVVPVIAWSVDLTRPRSAQREPVELFFCARVHPTRRGVSAGVRYRGGPPPPLAAVPPAAPLPLQASAARQLGNRVACAEPLAMRQLQLLASSSYEITSCSPQYATFS
ncbi:unnamed protein product, partial [Iphiclides podalirius]